MSKGIMHGWSVLWVLLPLLGACAGAVSWVIVAQVLSGLTGGTGRPADADPAEVWMPLMLACWWIGLPLLVAASLSWMWTDRLPRMSGAPVTAGLWGTAVGALAATCGMRTPFALSVGGIVTLIITLGAAIALWRTVRQTRAHLRDVDRVDHLQRLGTRVRADVESMSFLSTWVGGEPQFDVTAAYDTPSGRRSVTRRILTSPSGAPVAGGTVLLWFRGDGSDTDDIHVAEDPSSIRNPHGFTAPSP